MNKIIPKLNSKSPYLAHSNRLADVIAAIQVMGTYKFYKLDFNKWADRITGDETKGDYWKKIFIDHPEFFRLDSTLLNASLVWRRQYPKRLNVDTNEVITKEQYYNLSTAEKLRISRSSLDPSDIGTLINTAIEMHSRALQYEQDKRWWLLLLIPATGGLIGALIGALFK